jgi:hypothetical protein
MANGLWSVPINIAAPPVHQANSIIRLDKPRQELAAYHHAALGSPTPSTLLRAIRQGHLHSFPGLTTSLITKHLPKLIATTTMGHQDQEAKDIRSTSLPSTTHASPQPPSPDLDSDLAPPLKPRAHQLCAMMLFEKQNVLKSYSDQTRRFPVPSSRGNHYVFVLYHQDTNSIHAVAIPNRKAASIRDAWEATHKILVHQGHPPELYILDTPNI